MVTFVRDPAGWKQVFQSTGGVVGRHFKSIGHRAMTDARAKVGVDTWQLYYSINHRTYVNNGNVEMMYGSNNRVALLHHEGSDPHPIHARNPNGYLKFYWKKKRRWVITRKVNHPGTKPNPYLTYRLRSYVN